MSLLHQRSSYLNETLLSLWMQQKEQCAASDTKNVDCHRISLQRASLDIPWGITLCQQQDHCVYIKKIPQEPRYMVAKGGDLCRGDILVMINDQPVSSIGDFAALIQYIRVSLHVHVWVIRCKSPHLQGSLIPVVTPTHETNTKPTFPNHHALSSWMTMRPASRALFASALPTTYISRPHQSPPPPLPPPPNYRNPLFKDEDGKDLRFCDNLDDMIYGNNPEEGQRVHLFVRNIPNVPEWLEQRKTRWKADYSWNIRKRQRLEQALHCQKQVTFSPETLEEWLHVRKRQWCIQRRKRQRQRQRTQAVMETTAVPEMQWIDKLLQEQEEKVKERPRLRDLSFLFDNTLGCPDETIVHMLSYLPAREHSKLLSLSHTTRELLAGRENVWYLLCPSRWTLPRRPRKPWHEIYLHKLRIEFEHSSKVWDDFLTKAAAALLKGDHLHVIQTLTEEAESKSGRFSIDYTSGIVCERNSVLNLAVIHERQKVVRWLVEGKRADLESYDRGGFTPLMNAAWAGNKPLVRYLLSHGADRSKIAKFHYTKGIAPQGFAGLTAADWAEKKGHHDVAKLIRLGL